MEVVVGTIAAALVVLAIRLSFGTRSNEVWQALARDLETAYEPSWFGPHALEGRLQGHRVRVEEVTTSAGKSSSTRTQVLVYGHLDPELELSAESGWAELTKIFTGGDVKVGDADFDEWVRVKGPEVNALAALSEPARRAMEQLVGEGVTLKGGALKFTVAGRLVEDRSAFWGGATRRTVLGRIQRAVDASERLSVPRGEIGVALARNALEDPVPEVRKRNLEALAAHYPHGPLARKAASKALEDGDPSVRFLGARLAGGDGGAAELGALASGTAIPPAVRVVALTELKAMGRLPELLTAAHAMLGAGDAPLLKDVLAVIGTVPVLAGADLERAAMMERIAALAVRPELADACATALGALGDVRAQPLLLRLLATGDTDAKAAAARALGRVGTIEAVAPLLEQARPLLLNGGLKETLRGAVRQIQARLGDAEEGRLSLASEHDAVGALSVAEPKEEPSPTEAPKERIPG
jgi:HEAT repeat protein